MTLEGQEWLRICIQEIVQTLYRNSNKAKLNKLEGIEQTVRQQMLEYVSPKVSVFYQRCKLNTSLKK